MKPVVKSVQVNIKPDAFPVQSSLEQEIFFDFACRVFSVTGLSTAEWAAASFVMQQRYGVLYSEQSGDRDTLCTLSAY